jgi:hypothetical protein
MGSSVGNNETEQASEYSRDTDLMVLKIRTAKWVIRLYSVSSLKDIGSLIMASLAYSCRERVSELVPSIPFETSELDYVITH